MTNKTRVNHIPHVKVAGSIAAPRFFDSQAYETMSGLAAAIGTDPGTIYLSDDVVLDAEFTIAENQRLLLAKGVTITLGDFDLIIEGEFQESSDFQLFIQDGTGIVQFPNAPNRAFVSWWGDGYSAFSAALQAFSTGTLIITQDFFLDADLTIPEGLTLEFRYGAIISGYVEARVLTVNGEISALDTKIFGDFLTVTGLHTVNPKWWGAIGDGASDDTPFFDLAFAALSSSPSRLNITPGTYLIENGADWSGYNDTYFLFSLNARFSIPVEEEVILLSRWLVHPFGREDFWIGEGNLIFIQGFSFDTISFLTSGMITPTAEKVRIQGFYEVGDGGAGEFYWADGEDKQNHNGGTIIDPDHSIVPGEAGWWEPENVGAGCWIRVYSDFIDVSWFGAKGDVDLSSGTGTDDFSAISKAAEISNYLIFGPRVYGIGSTLILGDHTLQSNRTTIVSFPLDSGPLSLIRVGTETSHHTFYADEDLAVDIIRGSRELYLPAAFLAQLTVNDVILLTSNEQYVSHYGSIAYAGELVEVRTIENDHITIYQKVNHSYLVSESAKARLPHFYNFQILNNLNLQILNESSDPSRCLSIHYCKDFVGDISFTCLPFNCFAVAATNVYRASIYGRGTSNRNGINVNGASVDVEVRGIISARSHCFAGGADSENQGMPWNVRVTINGISTKEALDTHYGFGSVYFDSCTLQGETGIDTGAQYNLITNCTIHAERGLRLRHMTVSPQTKQSMKEYIVKGVLIHTSSAALQPVIHMYDQIIDYVELSDITIITDDSGSSSWGLRSHRLEANTIIIRNFVTQGNVSRALFFDALEAQILEIEGALLDTVYRTENDAAIMLSDCIIEYVEILRTKVFGTSYSGIFLESPSVLNKLKIKDFFAVETIRRPLYLTLATIEILEISDVLLDLDFHSAAHAGIYISALNASEIRLQNSSFFGDPFQAIKILDSPNLNRLIFDNIRLDASGEVFRRGIVLENLSLTFLLFNNIISEGSTFRPLQVEDVTCSTGLLIKDSFFNLPSGADLDGILAFTGTVPSRLHLQNVHTRGVGNTLLLEDTFSGLEILYIDSCRFNTTRDLIRIVDYAGLNEIHIVNSDFDNFAFQDHYMSLMMIATTFEISINLILIKGSRLVASSSCIYLSQIAVGQLDLLNNYLHGKQVSIVHEIDASSIGLLKYSGNHSEGPQLTVAGDGPVNKGFLGVNTGSVQFICWIVEQHSGYYERLASAGDDHAPLIRTHGPPEGFITGIPAAFCTNSHHCLGYIKDDSGGNTGWKELAFQEDVELRTLQTDFDALEVRVDILEGE